MSRTSALLSIFDGKLQKPQTHKGRVSMTALAPPLPQKSLKKRPGKRQGAMIKNLCTTVKINFKHPKLILGLFVVPVLIFTFAG